MDMKRKAALLALLLLLAACATSVQWTKPGAAQAQIDADLKACREAAEKAAAPLRQRAATPSGALSYPSGTELGADRQMALAQRQDACMRERGYRLVRSTGP